MSSQPVDHLHPVLDFAHRLRERLDSVAQTPLWSMKVEEQREALIALRQARAQVEALELRLLAEADRSGAATDTGANTAADWIAVETRQGRRDARSDLRLAEAIEGHDVLSTARAEGHVNTAQARAFVAALDRLPTTGEFAVTAEQRLAAETHLIALAEHHDAKALRILGGRIFEVIAPDLAEKFDGKALEAEEARALRRTTFTMFEDDEGTCHGRFRIPALHGQMLTKMILAISSPSRATNDTASSGIDPDLPTPVRHGIALTQLIETIPAKDLPKAGGCSATVVVTMTLEQLTADLDHAGVCTLDTGGRITAAEARRLACTAGIIPVVLGSLQPAPRRRPQTPTPQRNDADRHGCARRRLHRSGVRNTTGPLPRPPQHAMVPRRPHRRRGRPPALSPPPPTHPRPARTRPDTYPAARSASTAARRPGAAWREVGSRRWVAIHRRR